jgi:hypothetical protein
MTTHYGREALKVLTNNAATYEDIAEGSQAKFNHEDCPAGVDTKQRLYVKNLDGAYLWHCHNCSDSGYYRPRETVMRIKEDTTTHVPIPRKGFPMPTVSSLTRKKDYDTFELAGQLWLSQYEFNAEECWLLDITEGRDGIILPIYNHLARIVGCQVRRYNAKPKYVTYTTQRYSYLVSHVIDITKPLVVVEDLLSSYKLYLSGYPSLCLLGTSIDDKAKLILSRYERTLLWLDDDVAGHTAAFKLNRELDVICKNLTVMYNHQPKEIKFDVLQTMEV